MGNATEARQSSQSEPESQQEGRARFREQIAMGQNQKGPDDVETKGHGPPATDMMKMKAGNASKTTTRNKQQDFIFDLAGRETALRALRPVLHILRG